MEVLFVSVMHAWSESATATQFFLFAVSMLLEFRSVLEFTHLEVSVTPYTVSVHR